MWKNGENISQSSFLSHSKSSFSFFFSLANTHTHNDTSIISPPHTHNFPLFSWCSIALSNFLRVCGNYPIILWKVTLSISPTDYQNFLAFACHKCILWGRWAALFTNFQSPLCPKKADTVVLCENWRKLEKHALLD